MLIYKAFSFWVEGFMKTQNNLKTPINEAKEIISYKNYPPIYMVIPTGPCHPRHHFFMVRISQIDWSGFLCSHNQGFWSDSGKLDHADSCCSTLFRDSLSYRSIAGYQRKSHHHYRTSVHVHCDTDLRDIDRAWCRLWLFRIWRSRIPNFPWASARSLQRYHDDNGSRLFISVALLPIPKNGLVPEC